MKKKQSTLTIRLPNDLKHKVELMAEEQGVSLNQFALYAFTKEVIQTETQGFFHDIWKDKSKKEIFSDFDAVMKKVGIKRVGNKKVPDWDKL